MPDKRSHRGPHPHDRDLFGADALPRLASAAHDYCWLLDRDYPATATLALVGDRYRLRERQRLAVARSSCTSEQVAQRRQREMQAASVKDVELWIDGFNVLVTVEAALSGGLVLAGREGCYRDMASMHGTYRRVAETTLALERIGAALEELGAAHCRWLLDKPVSNSGRLAGMIRQTASQHGWAWEAELALDPDALLTSTSQPVVSADSAILDKCGRWLNLARLTIDRMDHVWLVDLHTGSRQSAANVRKFRQS